MLNRQEIAKKWALIPDDTDILVTHGPPFGTLDTVSPHSTHRCGCEELALRLKELSYLKLHVFGHIHGGYGQKVTYPRLREEGPIYYCYTSVNCEHMDEDYRPVNAPITVVM